MFRKQINAALSAPHHYATAMVLTVGAVAMGEFRITVVALFWLYALGENFSTNADVQKAVDACLKSIKTILKGKANAQSKDGKGSGDSSVGLAQAADEAAEAKRRDITDLAEFKASVRRSGQQHRRMLRVPTRRR